MQLVGWEKIYQPKNYRGLGIRSLKTSNKAFLLKLAWFLVLKSKSLWLAFIRESMNVLSYYLILFELVLLTFILESYH